MYQSYMYNLMNFYEMSTKEKLAPRSRTGIFTSNPVNYLLKGRQSP